jgi:hypothetical protein
MIVNTKSCYDDGVLTPILKTVDVLTVVLITIDFLTFFMKTGVLTAVLMTSDVLTAVVMTVDISHMMWLSISRRQGVQDRLLHSVQQSFETSRTSHETTRRHTLEERSDGANYIFLTREEDAFTVTPCRGTIWRSYGKAVWNHQLAKLR